MTQTAADTVPGALPLMHAPNSLADFEPLRRAERILLRACATGRALIERNAVVAMDQHLRAQHHERLHQVVSKRIVVIDEQQAHRFVVSFHSPSSANARARRTMALFASTS